MVGLHTGRDTACGLRRVSSTRSRRGSRRYAAPSGLPSRRRCCWPRPPCPGSAPLPSGGAGPARLRLRLRPYGDEDQATSSEVDGAERDRLIALVELARTGDKDAFGLLYDHYQASVYRFLYHRTRSQVLAEDLTSETFFRALRSMNSFRWQGKDFGAWLMTIARNLTTDHFKSGRTRLEMTTEDMTPHDDATEGPEGAVLAGLTNEVLLKALTELPTEQRECLIMRFLQGMSHRRDRAGPRPLGRRRQAAPAARRAQPGQAAARGDEGHMTSPVTRGSSRSFDWVGGSTSSQTGRAP